MTTEICIQSLIIYLPEVSNPKLVVIVGSLGLASNIVSVVMW